MRSFDEGLEMKLTLSVKIHQSVMNFVFINHKKKQHAQGNIQIFKTCKGPPDDVSRQFETKNSDAIFVILIFFACLKAYGVYGFRTFHLIFESIRSLITELFPLYCTLHLLLNLLD